MNASDQEFWIADWCGWTHIERSGILIPNPPWIGYPPKTQIIGQKQQLPSYTSDLNAMREAELALSSDQYHDYAYGLLQETDGGELAPEFLSAPAEKRAEAFLKSLLLWEDNQP